MSRRELDEHAGLDIRCAWCGRKPDGPVVYMPVRYCSSECTAAGEFRKNLCGAPFFLLGGFASVLLGISEGALPMLFPALLLLSLGTYSLHLVRVGYKNQDKRNIYLDTGDESSLWPYACEWCGKEDATNWFFDGAMRPYCSLACRSTENLGWNACLAILAFVGAGFFIVISLLPDSVSAYMQLFAVLSALVGIYLFYTVVLGIRALDRKGMELKKKKESSEI